MLIESPIDRVSAAYGTLNTSSSLRNAPGEGQLPIGYLSGAFSALMASAQHAGRAGVAIRDSESLSSQMFEPTIADSHERRQRSLRDDYESVDVSAVVDDRMDVTSVQARSAKGYGRSAVASATQSADGFGLGLNREGMDGAAVRTDAPSPGADAGREDVHGRLLVDGGGASRPGATDGRSDGGSQTSFFSSQVTVDPKAVGLQTAHVVESAGVVAGSAPVRAGGQQSGNLAQQIAQIMSANRGGGAESIRAASPSPAAENAGPQIGQRGSAGTSSPNRTGRSEAGAGKSAAADATDRTEFDRLVRSIRLRAGERHSSARLHLDPPELGRIQVDVRMNGAQLEISVRTETPEARESLSRRAAQLRAALQQHGIQVDRFDVTLDFLIEQGTEEGAPRGSGFAASSGRDGWKGGMDTVERTASSDDAFEFAEVTGEPAIAVVGDGRLDIRV